MKNSFNPKRFRVSLCQTTMRMTKLLLCVFLALPLASISQDEDAPSGEPVEIVIAEASAPDAQSGQLQLSIDEAVKLALEHNLELQIQEFNPRLDEYRLQDALAGYIPTLRGNVNWRNDSSPGGINPATNEPFPSNITETTSNGASIEGLLPTGTSYTIGFDTFERNGDFIPFDRRHSGNLSFFLSQPLLKNLWIDNTRRFMRVSRLSVEQSYSQFELSLMQVIRNVEFAYYDLIASAENVKVQEKALELGLKTLEENRTRVKVGVMAPLDETEAEAQVASSKASLIQARQSFKRRANALKRLITDDFANLYEVDIIPTEPLETDTYDFDVYASWSQGLMRRPEIVQSRISIDQQDIAVKYQKNQLFPQLDLVASYSINGLDGQYRNVWDDFRRMEDESTLIGIRYSIPLYNQGPKARYKEAKAQKQLLLVRMKDLEQRIQAEIADAVDSAQSAREQVLASSEARKFAAKALEVEQVKLANGKSTSFIVLRLQRDLTQRQADEISALANYRRALTTLSFSEGTILERNKVFINSRQKEPTWLKTTNRLRSRYNQ